jgi:hypothetical protein
MSGDAIAGYVPLRLCPMGLHEDGLPAHHPLPSACPTPARPAAHRRTLPGSARRRASMNEWIEANPRRFLSFSLYTYIYLSVSISLGTFYRTTLVKFSR